MLTLPSVTNTNMEQLECSPQQQREGNEVDVSDQQVSRNNSRGIRVVGNRIYDSANGKTCHQCRQKTRDFAATCKNPRNGKPCVIKLCHKCLLNRYGERAEEVEQLSDWMCPKCRGICNCSFCMKRRGQQPTGALAHTAKASGFNSVSEMLRVKASENSELNNVNNKASENSELNKVNNKASENSELNKVNNNAAVLPTKEATVAKEQKGDENNCKAIVVRDDGHNNVGVMSQVDTKVLRAATEKKNQDIVYVVKDGPETWAANDFFFDPMSLAIGDGGENVGARFQMCVAQSLEPLKCTFNVETEIIEEEIPLPTGIAITEILGIEFPQKDVGKAFQFLEFCRVFGKALDVKKGEAEAILRELIRKQNLRRGQSTLVVQFQIRLLNLILPDSGNESPSLTTTKGDNSWLKALEDLISESSDLELKDFPLDWLKEGINGYYDLDLSNKLRLLNFICDEALGTETLRGYIDEENERFAQEKKEAKSKLAVAKEKEKGLKQKLQDEMARAVLSEGATFSISEHDALVSKIKGDAAKAHSEMLEAKGTVPKRKRSSDAMRIEPEFLDTSGQAFWKLKSYNGECALLMQDIKMEDADGDASSEADERWFLYDASQKEEIDKYISSRAKKSKKTRKVHCII